MTLPMLYPIVLPILGGLASGLAVVLLALVLGRRRETPFGTARSGSGIHRGRLVFEGRCLIDGDGPIHRAFSDPSAGGDDWDRAIALLEDEFPVLVAERSPPSLADGEIVGSGGSALIIRQDGSKTFLVLGPVSSDAVARVSPVPSGIPNAVTNGVPFPIWLKRHDGSVEWVNRAYLDLLPRDGPGSEDVWPPPDLFDPDLLPEAGPGRSSCRIPLLTTAEIPKPVFDVFAHATEDGTLYAAASADTAARAERSLRDFTQTLTKTFAHLTIGLAIFDRSRRMILFNPALSELTGLSAASMTQKPTLAEFLDRLRERRIVPEPKDYTSWRRKLTELEAAATHGSYEETWSLPTGQTYRVTGRPHPDGAIILLIEDITAEISLTRRFRAELEIGQDVIDSLDEAIAVFSGEGYFAMANAAYVDLWGHDPDRDLTTSTVADITAVWHARTAPTPVWGDLRDFVHQGHERAEWTADVMMSDGRPLFCRFVPLSGGGTVVTFRPRRSEDKSGALPSRRSA